MKELIMSEDKKPPVPKGLVKLTLGMSVFIMAFGGLLAKVNVSGPDMIGKVLLVLGGFFFLLSMFALFGNDS
jgi:tellurite resistance protein TehA-like permease